MSSWPLSLARALSAFAGNIRLKRRQMAKEKAAKTTVKIIFPLVLFLFPSMFLVLLGPAVLSILRGMAAMGQGPERRNRLEKDSAVLQQRCTVMRKLLHRGRVASASMQV